MSTAIFVKGVSFQTLHFPEKPTSTIEDMGASGSIDRFAIEGTTHMARVSEKDQSKQEGETLKIQATEQPIAHSL